LRRLWRVNSEALLLAAGQNLKRLLQQRGWGRRPFPDGVAAAEAYLWILRPSTRRLRREGRLSALATSS
jgi:hypothetical protein